MTKADDKQHQKHLDLILEASGDGIYGLDCDGITTFVNPAAERLTGYSSEEMVGKPQHVLIHHTRVDGSEYPRLECPIYAAFNDGKVHHVSDEVFWRKDGSSFPVEYVSTPILDDGELVGAVVSFRDITERKRAEAALRESEERYRKIFDATHDAIFLVDAGDGAILNANEEACRMLGYSHNALTAMTADDIHPQEIPALRNFFAEVSERGKSTTDTLGNTTDFTYNQDNGRQETITAPAPSAGAVRPQTRFYYAGKRARYYTSSSGTGLGGSISILTESSACATLSACNGLADETQTTSAYPDSVNPNNLLLISQTTAAGDGSLSSQISMTYDDIGNLETLEGPLGTADTTRFRYDATRLAVGVTGPDPDGGGPLKHRAIKTTYNARSQPTFVEIGTVNSQSDPDWANFLALQKQETVYDAYARSTETRAFQDATSTILALQQTSYDNVGRPECAAIRMNSATFTAPPSSTCTLATPGADGDDRIFKAVYDAAGQALQTLSAYGTADQQVTVEVQYTQNGLVDWQTDANDNKTDYIYDGFDRPLKVEYPSPTIPGQSSSTDYEQFSYDANSNVLTERRRNAQSFTYTYDNLNRLTFLDAPTSNPDYDYDYDNLDRLLSTCETPCPSTHTINYVYDQLSRLKSETGPLGVVDYDYDAAGRRTKLQWPGAAYYVNCPASALMGQIDGFA